MRRFLTFVLVFLSVAGAAPACGGSDRDEGDLGAFDPDHGGGNDGHADGTDGGEGTASTGDGQGGTSGGDATQGDTGTETSETGNDGTAGSGDGDYDGEPGEFVLEFDGRSYHLYVPASYNHGTPAPLVLGIHGAGDSASSFYGVSKAVGWNTVADAAGVILAVPDTKSPYRDFAVWSGNPSEDIPEMIAEMGELLDVRDEIGTHYNLDPGSLHAFGFSDGGLFLAVTAMEYSAEFASVAIVGYGWGGTYIVSPSRKLPVQFACGAADSFYDYATMSEQFLASRGHDTRMLTAQGVGHDFVGVLGRYPPQQLWEWMSDRS